MPLFTPDYVAPRDPAGWGRWLTGHSLEHFQFVSKSAALTPPITIPEYDILRWSDDPQFVVFWLNVHQQIHLALRQTTGVTGIDLSLLDFNDDEAFEEWLQDHSIEHGDMRSFFGVS